VQLRQEPEFQRQVLLQAGLLQPERFQQERPVGQGLLQGQLLVPWRKQPTREPLQKFSSDSYNLVCLLSFAIIL
jgi:hypothetical protein